LALERSPRFRWFFCCGSRSARCPIQQGRRGLFAPLLVLGAQFGLFFGLACQLAFPGLHIQPEGFAVVGMAALFTGVVRAPLTGIVLVTEMTADVTMLLPMLGACAMAMLTPTLLKDPPIYDSLRERTVKRERERLDQTKRTGREQG
jgi:CIC family chloride channel protein